MMRTYVEATSVGVGERKLFAFFLSRPWIYLSHSYPYVNEHRDFFVLDTSLCFSCVFLLFVLCRVMLAVGEV
jgi:hypothetical protein